MYGSLLLFTIVSSISSNTLLLLFVVLFILSVEEYMVMGETPPGYTGGAKVEEIEEPEEPDSPPPLVDENEVDEMD